MTQGIAIPNFSTNDAFCWRLNSVRKMIVTIAREKVEFTEPWKPHCLESHYGSTTVQIVYSRLLPKVNSVLSDACICGKEFGVSNLNTQNC